MNTYWKALKIRKLNDVKRRTVLLEKPRLSLDCLSSGFFNYNFKEKKRLYSLVSGRAWKMWELRNKSDHHLNLLWMVLLREKQAINSDRYACLQRKWKVKQLNSNLDKILISMKRVKEVSQERTHLKAHFVQFLEYFYIRKQQVANDPKFLKLIEETERLEAESKRLKALPKSKRGDVYEVKTIDPVKLTDKSETVEQSLVVMEQAASLEAKNTKFRKPNVDLLTKNEQEHAELLKTKLRKGTLIKKYVKGAEKLEGKEKRRLVAHVDSERAKIARNIFLKEVAGISYKLRNQKAKLQIENKI